MTLIEVMVTVVVLGVIGTATLPVIMGVSEAYSQLHGGAGGTRTVRVRRRSHQPLVFANILTRLRHGVDSESKHRLVQLSDGRAIELIDGQIVLRDAAGKCRCSSRT